MNNNIVNNFYNIKRTVKIIIRVQFIKIIKNHHSLHKIDKFLKI